VTGSLARGVLWLALAALQLTLTAAIVTRFDVIERVANGFRDTRSEQRAHPRGTRGVGTRGRPAAPAPKPDMPAHLGNAVSSVLEAAWRAVRIVLLSLACMILVAVAVRIVFRRRRLLATRRFELQPSREDLATPYQREKLFDAWHGQLAPRWWVRSITGAPSVALEIHQLRGGPQFLSLAATQRDARMLEGRLAATYPDARLIPANGSPRWARHVVRLKKRTLFVARIQTVKDDEQALVESIVTTMAHVGGPASVQVVLTPAPWSAHRFARRLFKQREHELTRAEHLDRADIGVDSVVEDKELKGALETQHRSLFWAELRVASESREAARALAGLFSEAHSENVLMQRKMRLRARLYGRRIALGASNPVPSFLHGVLSASELAALWSLPRQRVKAAQLVRAPVGRAPAPPQIARSKELQIMRDEHGPVGIFKEDRKYGLAFIGGQGVGKTSAMARTIEIDARDPDAALIVLDPKHDLAERALSLVPAGRTVWYMDLARPEVGISPLGIDAEPSAVADVVLQAMREAHEPGAILSQSDEFLRNAALAVCAAEEEPTLWHMYELLSPRRGEYREQVVNRLEGQSGLGAVARYWGRTFPERWMDARGHMAGQLAAPLNKINRLLATPTVDVALRHPFALDLGEVIRKREVLIVNGALGEIGEQNAVVVLQLLLQLVHQAMKQQQRLPEQHRVRVCLKVDEAHLVLTPSFATMLALHRAAGPLEVTAAWQYTEQIEDRAIRAGLKSLLRSRSMFSMGEVSDAREHAEVAMEVYSDLIRTERDDRERMRFGPDDIVRLPTFAAMNSWVAQGARQSAFFAQTLPIGGSDPELREQHLRRQREAGASWPTFLLDPIEAAGEETDEGPGPSVHSRSVSVKSGTKDEGDTDESSNRNGDPGAEALGDEAILEVIDAVEPQQEASGDVGAPSQSEIPLSYAVVHRTDVTGLIWDKVPRDAGVAERLEPQARDLEIVRALWRYEVLLLTQLWQHWWPENDVRAARKRLKRLLDAGWFRRFQLRGPRNGHEAGYVLARHGFLAGQSHRGPDGPYIPAGARWQERSLADYRAMEHLLQTNAWVLAFRTRVAEHAVDWLGEHEGRLEVPTKLSDGRRIAIEAEDLKLERYQRVRDLRSREFRSVCPDATVCMDMPAAGRSFDLMIELDRTKRPAKNFDKFRRYDALITAWWKRIERFRRMGEPPAVVFVCVDEDQAFAFMSAAEGEITGRLARPGTAQSSWPRPGRERTLFVAERDVHEGNLRAWKLPAEPAMGATDLPVREVRLPGGRSG
jgi:Replication-relaxation